jgi:hypothetical protein
VGAHDERGYRVVAHEVATGADCDGCLIVHERGELADLVCNVCGAVIRSVPKDRAAEVLWSWRPPKSVLLRARTAEP